MDLYPSDMDIKKSNKQELDEAIASGDVQLARWLILDNNVEPMNMNVSFLDIVHFIQKVCEMDEETLLRQLVKHNSVLAGKALWRVLDNVELATKLVLAGSDVNLKQDSWQRFTFLHVLLESQDSCKLRLAELMMEHSADVDAVNAASYSVLEWALTHGAPGNFIEKLLSHSRALFQTNLGVITRFHRTAELLPKLIAAGSPDELEITKRAHEGLFCLIKESSCEVDVIEALFESHNITVDVLDDSHLTPLYYAITRENPKVVKLLLKHNADPNKKAQGKHLVSLALMSQGIQGLNILNLLIKHGADLHCQDDDGQHPIHSACRAGSLCNTFLLICLGADFNIMDNMGQTPLSLLPIKAVMPSITDRMLHSFILRSLALAAFRGEEINSNDMDLIRASPTMQKHYNASFDELQKMQRIVASDGISYYTFLTENIHKTSKLTGRESLSSIFNNLSELKKLFPYYYCDLRNAFLLAKRREQQITAQEQFLRDIFAEVFQTSLPYLVINKIANYICPLNNFILDFCMRTIMIWNYNALE